MVLLRKKKISCTLFIRKKTLLCANAYLKTLIYVNILFLTPHCLILFLTPHCSMLDHRWRALGVSMDVTEVRYPVAALWELYKSAPLSKTMGKSCTGVQARCPIAWSPAAILRKPNHLYSLTISAERLQTQTRALRCVVLWKGGKKKENNESRNKTCFMF